MSDYFFSGSIDSDDEGCLIENGFKIARGVCKYKASAISHAVSNHDSLVEEVERLRGELDELIKFAEEHKRWIPLAQYPFAIMEIDKLLAKIKGEDNE